MTRFFQWRAAVLCLASMVLLAIAASAQQKTPAPQQTPVYDPSREVSVQGTVVTYTQNSSVPPLGPHVTLQTGSGILDAHLGNAHLLDANHLTLAPGDSVRVIGENVAFGSGMQFVVRLIQKGNQAVLLRSTRGFPLRPMVKPQGGAQ